MLWNVTDGAVANVVLDVTRSSSSLVVCARALVDRSAWASSQRAARAAAENCWPVSLAPPLIFHTRTPTPTPTRTKNPRTASETIAIALRAARTGAAWNGSGGGG